MPCVICMFSEKGILIHFPYGHAQPANQNTDLYTSGERWGPQISCSLALYRRSFGRYVVEGLEGTSKKNYI